MSPIQRTMYIIFSQELQIPFLLAVLHGLIECLDKLRKRLQVRAFFLPYDFFGESQLSPITLVIKIVEQGLKFIDGLRELRFPSFLGFILMK